MTGGRIEFHPRSRAEVPTVLGPIQLNVDNIQSQRKRAPTNFSWIRLDTNDDCNLHCVYCHNKRSKDMLSEEEFGNFLSHNVLGVESFQVGCRMEPTLDPRMTDFMLRIAASPAKPRKNFRLQTNGVLLHRHDVRKLKEARLTQIAVSVDAADASVHKSLRGGTSLPKVERNLRQFRQTCPEVTMVFLTTVTSANIDQLESLIELGLDIGISEFNFRQMFYFPNSKIVDHKRMPELLVGTEEFATMKERVSSRFAAVGKFFFFDNSALAAISEGVQKRSKSEAET